MPIVSSSATGADVAVHSTVRRHRRDGPAARVVHLVAIVRDDSIQRTSSRPSGSRAE